jgi:hypothetical protein
MTDNVDIIKKRGIKKIYYFHVDHFEPFTGGSRVDNISGIRNFIKRTKSFNHSKKMSLFIPIPYGRILGTDNVSDAEVFSFDNDLVSFYIKNSSAQKTKESIKMLYENGYDIHIHIHHERWTSNDLDISKFSELDLPMRRYVLNDGKTNDSVRFKNHLELCLDFIKDIIPDFNSWGFVHGCWALNASDPEICNIDDEIIILKNAGCIGDFSFPAGRKRCDPEIESPFTIKPIAAKRSYDKPASKQRVVGKDLGAFNKDRFLIWSSKIKHRHTSLDYYSDAIKKNLSNPNLIINNWLENAPVIDGNLFIKTHSHSMDLRYWENYNDPIIPITSTNINKAFAILNNICNKTKTTLEFSNVREVLSILKSMDKKNEY